ncbi:MAG: hypothetical protein P4L84_22380 [Isosphaeraceae bacterium]|nr:hypothetical protein [Isosphaeraceae bacterium]
MLRFTALWITRVLAATAGLFLAAARAADEPPRSVPTPTPAPAPAGDINIFLSTPADIEALWKSLGQPDFVLRKGGEVKPPGELKPAPATEAQPAAVVDSVSVRGEVEKDLASLTVELGVTLASNGPVWVPVRLDDAVLTAVREGERLLEAQSSAGRGWQVELRGKGLHTVQVALRTRLKSTADGYRLELAIPEAGKTRFQVDIPQRVVDATAGADEPIEPVVLAKEQRSRLAAHLTARPRLEVSWRVEAETGVQLPHLLAMQGEIAVDVDSGSIRTRSSWMVQAVRGTTRTLELRLAPDVEVLEVELDGQSPPAGVERVGGETKLTINLVEPLRPGAPKKLTVVTRLAVRALPARVSLHGFALANAKEQTGAVGIAQNGNLYLQGSAGRGVRQIDPRELPAELRVRPATALAYQFVDQPFELVLVIEASPPLVRTDSRTTVALSAGGAKVETSIDYKTTRGRLFEARVGLPRGLELETVGPDDIVESTKVDADPAGAAGARVLTVMLKSKARDQGAFSLRLSGRQAIDPAKPVEVALFRPVDSTSGGGRIAVTTDRDLAVEWPAPSAPEAFRLAVGEPPADWPWPPDHATSELDEPPALWLRHDDHPATLPLLVTVHPRTIAHESSLVVRVERKSVEVRQEIVCTVHFGTLEQLELTIPPQVQGRWEVEEGNVASRKELGTNEAGEAVTRLRFGQPVSDRTRLRLRYRVPLAAGLEPEKRAEVVVPWVRVREGTSAPARVRVVAEPGIDVQPVGGGWTRLEGEDAASGAEFGLPVRFTLVGDGPGAAVAPLRLAATARPLAELPPLVVARHWLRTVQGPDLGLRVNAWYWVETHQGSLPVGLPAGAVLERVKVGGEARDQVEPLPQGAGYRIRFPSRWASSPVLVGLEYRLDARFVGAAWVPPRVLEGALVEETLWEARLPASRALLGVPAGWTDENLWRWDRYVWKRRPWKSASGLTAWVCGPSGRSQATEPIDDDPRGDYHDYLFGRLGAPAALHPLVVARFWLLTLCSGGALAFGSVLLLAWRPPARVLVPALLTVALCVAVGLPTSVTLVLLQSSLIGVVLLLVMAALQFLVERRRSAADLFAERSGLTSSPGSSVNLPGVVGSDDSTAIRVRAPASTKDYVVSLPPPAGERPGGQGSSVRPG